MRPRCDATTVNFFVLLLGFDASVIKNTKLVHSNYGGVLKSCITNKTVILELILHLVKLVHIYKVTQIHSAKKV